MEPNKQKTKPKRIKAQEEKQLKVIRYDSNHELLTKEDLKSIVIDDPIVIGILNKVYNRALEKLKEQKNDETKKPIIDI